MSDVIRRGRGRPVTLIAPGGNTDGVRRAETVQAYGAGVAGTKVSFDYQHSGHFASFARIRREAERDAAEVLALADQYDATRAIGISRGARAIVGVLAEVPLRFERVVLLLPPGGHAAGRYYTWLEALAEAGGDPVSADILVIGQRGDQGHPARTATQWAERLGARLDVFPSRGFYTEPACVRLLITEFLNR